MERKTKARPDKLEALLSQSTIRVRSNVRDNIIALSPSKKRALLPPLVKIARATIPQLDRITIPQLNRIMNPLFSFDEDQTLYGAIIRRRTSLIIMITQGILHILSVIDNDRLRRNRQAQGCWLENKTFASRSFMCICFLKGVLFFLAVFARYSRAQYTKFAWSIHENRPLRARELRKFLEDNGFRFA